MHNRYWLEIYTKVKFTDKNKFNETVYNYRQKLPNLGRGHFNLAYEENDLTTKVVEFCLIGDFDYVESRKWLVQLYNELKNYCTFQGSFPFEIYANILDEDSKVNGPWTVKAVNSIEESFNEFDNYLRYFEC